MEVMSLGSRNAQHLISGTSSLMADRDRRVNTIHVWFCQEPLKDSSKVVCFRDTRIIVYKDLKECEALETMPPLEGGDNMVSGLEL